MHYTEWYDTWLIYALFILRQNDMQGKTDDNSFLSDKHDFIAWTNEKQ